MTPASQWRLTDPQAAGMDFGQSDWTSAEAAAGDLSRALPLWIQKQPFRSTEWPADLCQYPDCNHAPG